MKKALLILGLVAFLGTGFTSCKKDCKCTGYIDGVEYGSATSSKTKKKDCKDYSESVSAYGYTTTVDVKCTWGK